MAKLVILWIVLTLFQSWHMVAFSVLSIDKILDYRMAKKISKPKNCSLAHSAIVSRILEEDFFPAFDKYTAEVPSKCPFHRERNIFVWIFANKTNDGGWWKCELCGKFFYEEHYLHSHMDRKHRNIYLNSSKRVCLADYCDVFRCNLHERYPYNMPSSIACEDKNVLNLRRKCENLMRMCLPDKMFHYIYDAIYGSICSTLTCEKFLHPFQDPFSVWTVIILSICVPIGFVLLCTACWNYYENMDEDDSDEIYKALRSADDIKEPCEEVRYNFARERGADIRYRQPRDIHQFPVGNSYSIRY